MDYVSTLPAAALLLGVALFAGRKPGRAYLRFACILFAALGTAGLAAAFFAPFHAVAFVVALLVASLGSAALVLALIAVFSRVPPLAAGIGLALALAAGLGAALGLAPVLAVTAPAIGLPVVFVAAFGRLALAPLRSVQAMAAAMALLCGGLALMDQAAAAAMLFFAVGVVGTVLASQPFVEQQGAGRSICGIG